VSWCAIYSFWIAARLFHSVPAARAADAIGQIILLPGRLFLSRFESADQSSSLANPMLFALINGTLLGLLVYLLLRWLLPRFSQRAKL
jgi:hypothetical protein